VREGYCGACHDWTGGNNRVEDPFNRNGPPGIRVHATPIDASDARQIVGIYTESSAMHSRSKGWIPTLFLAIDHVPLIGPDTASQRLQLMLRPSDAESLIEHLTEGLTAARADAAYGLREGP
jgi:hypothetical protein